jgi:nucleotide-binding universal stress UspA family protein
MKVLVATDGSEFSNAAIGRMPSILGDSRVDEIKVFSVYEAAVAMAAEPFAISGEYYAELTNLNKSTAQSNVDSAANTLASEFPDADISVAVGCGNPAPMIVEEAKHWNADLIVVGSHGFGFWNRLLLGSVSNAIVQHAPCSVLVVRSPELEKK